MKSRRPNPVGWALAMAAVTASAAGCTSSGAPTPSPAASVDGGVVSASDRSAWSAEINDIATTRSSDLERAILADGTITAAEVATAKEAFGACMAAYGAEVTWAADTDAHTVGYQDARAPSPELFAQMENQQKTCDQSTPKSAVSLYYQMQRNPQRQDEFSIVAACFVRKGVMPPGYTGADFARDRSTEPRPTQFETEAAGACFAAPLAP